MNTTKTTPKCDACDHETGAACSADAVLRADRHAFGGPGDYSYALHYCADHADRVHVKPAHIKRQEVSAVASA